MATLTQDESAPIFYTGWYGLDINSNECTEFPLISGTGTESAYIYDEISAVYAITSNGQGVVAFDGSQTIPFLISKNPLKKLECGKSYRIILKPKSQGGSGSVDIPHFVFANAGSSDQYRLKLK